MNAELGMVFPSLVLFAASLVLTALSVWVGTRLAPWFLKEAGQPQTVRSYFLDPFAETDITKLRVVTMLIALAVMLAALLAMAVAVKFGGVALF